VGYSACDAVLAIANAHPLSQVVWVAGNHEFYRQNIEKQIDLYRRTFGDRERIHFLENEKIVIGGVVFFGCTLWTGFDMLGQERIDEASKEARNAIADFSLIRAGEDHRRFNPKDACNMFKASYRWLVSELDIHDLNKAVIVSHFPPCIEASNPYFSESMVTPYFQANCKSLIERYQPAIWLCGHNHSSAKLSIGNTRLISSQLGYLSEGYMSCYDSELKFCIGQ
jgi:hypothetical protein